MGIVFSAIGSGLNAFVSAVAWVLMTIVGGLTNVFVAIFDVLTCGACSGQGGNKQTRNLGGQPTAYNQMQSSSAIAGNGAYAAGGYSSRRRRGRSSRDAMPTAGQPIAAAYPGTMLGDGSLYDPSLGQSRATQGQFAGAGFSTRAPMMMAPPPPQVMMPLNAMQPTPIMSTTTMMPGAGAGMPQSGMSMGAPGLIRY